MPDPSATSAASSRALVERKMHWHLPDGADVRRYVERTGTLRWVRAVRATSVASGDATTFQIEVNGTNITTGSNGGLIMESHNDSEMWVDGDAGVTFSSTALTEGDLVEVKVTVNESPAGDFYVEVGYA